MKRQLYILKFGGTSVGKIDGFKNIRDYLLNINEKDNKLKYDIPKLVILSAASNSTNKLENIYKKFINKECATKEIENYISDEKNLNINLGLDITIYNKYELNLKEIYSKYINNQ